MKPRNHHHSSFFSIIPLILLLCQFFSTTSSQSSSSNERRVVCYYTNWSAYRQGPAKFLPENINPYLCTHLIYAFGGLGPEGIKPFDKYQDIDKGGYSKFNGLKTYNKALKTLLAIGGWNEGSSRFSKLVANKDARKTWIRNSIKFLRQNNFDGLDLDWEYPGARDGGVAEDKENYADFISELRTAFEDEAKGSGRSRLLLTIAVPAGLEWIQKGFDIESINRDVDFINLLTYDYHASTEPAANHHAPLKASGDAKYSEYDYKSQLNIDYTIDYYLQNGASSSKLVVGLPTYGRSYTLFNSESYGVGAPASGPGTKGKYTKEPGYLAYYEICEGVKSGDWTVENEYSEAQGPHAVNGDQWVGYDDIRMISLKSKWVKDNRLGGIMFWSIDNDDFRGSCHEKPFPLIEAGKTAYLTGEYKEQRKTSSLSTNSNSRFSMTRRTTTPRPRSTSTTTKKSRRKRPKKPKTTTTTSTTPPTPSTTIDPFNTPAPPTTPETGVAFECTDDGFFPHPRDCKKYFWCLDAPGLGLVAHHFTCPSGLFFNKNTDSCDYARNVPCKPGGSAATTPKATTPTPTTTTTKATTTTTAAADDEEEYEYYDEDEEEQQQQPKQHDASGKSAKEVNDIRDLLSIIKKLGGVEELEKYLAENPSVADELEYEDEEDETTTTTVAPSIPNRFSPKLKFTPKSYSPLQRNRVKSTNANNANSQSSTVESDSKESKSIFRPKYVTLSRETTNSNNRRKSTVGPSSTETSIVVRFSDQDKLLEDEEDDDDSPVTIVTSRPYSQVTGSDTKSKYVTFQRNRLSTTTTIAPEVEEDEYLETEEEEIEAPLASSTTIKPKVRIPFRKTSTFTQRLTSTTTTTTTPAPTTRRGTRPTPAPSNLSTNQNVNYRKNFLSERRRISQQQQPVAEESRRESTSTSQIIESTTSNNIQNPKNRRRFRPSPTTSTILVQQTTTALPPLPGQFQSAVIRRRTRKPTTTTISPTTTTRTTTSKPSRGTIKANQLVKIPDSNDYYYYYYDDEDEQLDKSQSQSIASSSNSNSQQQQQLSRRSLNLIDSSDSKITESKIIVKNSTDSSTTPNSSTKPLSSKIHLHPNGSIECLDTGVFPHPSSCSKYVHCIPNENGIGLKVWTYSCPDGLSFDTIGGMCNWSDESSCP